MPFAKAELRIMPPDIQRVAVFLLMTKKRLHLFITKFEIVLGCLFNAEKHLQTALDNCWLIRY